MYFKKLCILIATAAFIFTVACQGNKNTEAGTTPATANPDSITACNADSIMNLLSSNIPHEVDAQFNLAYNHIMPSVQPCFDIFSWQTFIALNWPADANGAPLATFTANPQAQRVWEYYKDPSEVFQTNEFRLPFMGPYKMQAGLKGLHQFSTLSSELTMNLPPNIKQATGQPLIDKNLNFVTYEVRMNPDEVNYIENNGLNTKEGQVGKTIFFPAGTYTAGVGAMEIKSTWKILVAGVDDSTKYYHRPAVIYVPANQSATGQALYLRETVGLVAMHIIHKTNRFQTWVWTSFEHIDNAPEQAQVSSAGNNYSFFNPACTTCKIDSPPAPAKPYLWQPKKPYAGKYATIVNNDSFGTQVVRQNPVYAPTDSINKKMQNKLASINSVFANYRLIGTQWSLKTETFPSKQLFIPDTLANTTLETYKQNSGCTQTCHIFATNVVDSSADFSFLLSHARSQAYLKTLQSKQGSKK